MGPNPDGLSRGECSNCGAPLSKNRIVIEYETSSGEPRAFAECPDCFEIVRPS